MDFSGKTAVITGSGRGIGRAIAAHFAERGANVVVSDIDLDAITKAASEIHGSVVALKADVLQPEEIDSLLAGTLERFGRIDIVVNNAGVTRDAFLVRMNESDWDLVLGINLKGAFLVTKAAAKIMIKQRYGRIVNISSIVGLNGNPGQTNYSASKAGLIGFTKSAAKELAARGITVNAVAPGFITTEMTAALPDAVRRQLLEKAYIKRPGTPEDVATAVLFLASDEASYITGQILAVDGGLSMS